MTVRRALLAVALTLGLVVVTAAPASAHAQLQSTEPVSGQRLDRAPDRVVLHFSEAVEVSFGSIAVHDEDGHRLAPGRAFHPDGDRRAVALRLPELRRGGYVVTWRAISADSHPVRGAFTFRVGDADGEDRSADMARRLLAAEGGDTTVGAVFGVVRFAAFAGLLLLLGSLFFTAAFWPRGRRDPRLRVIVAVAWVTTFVASAVAVGLQGAYGGGLGLSAAFDPTVVGDALATRYGKVAVARLVLLLVAVPLIRHLLRTDTTPRRAAVVATAAAGLALAATPGPAGHAGADANPVLAVALSTVHVAAAATWTGGLTALVVALTRDRSDDLKVTVARFSTFAFAAVLAVVVTGSIQGWRQSASLDAVTSTTYGRLLSTKVALVAVIVVVASFSRRIARARLDPGSLRRLVGVEVALAVVVVAVTSLLVNSVPARSALAQPVTVSVTAGKVLVDITVDPAKRGPTNIHLYTLTRQGAVRPVEEMQADMRLVGGDVNPLPIPLRVAGPGHFAAYGFDVPIAGRWRITVHVRTSDIDTFTGTTDVTIR